MQQRCSYWTDFHESFFKLFRNCVEKIQVELKYDKRNRYFTGRQKHIVILSRSILPSDTSPQEITSSAFEEGQSSAENTEKIFN